MRLLSASTWRPELCGLIRSLSIPRRQLPPGNVTFHSPAHIFGFLPQADTDNDPKPLKWLEAILMLADHVDVVIGCDTHRDTHAIAVISTATGGVDGQFEIPTTRDGYHEALKLAIDAFPGRRAWAIEGTGSYGKGFCRYLTSRGEWVIEVSRPLRRPLRSRPKSDPIDAIQAARTALSQSTHNTPRGGELREGLRVLMITRDSQVQARARALKQIKAMIVTAPDDLRDKLRTLAKVSLLRACVCLRARPTDRSTNATRVALRTLARAAQSAGRDAKTLEVEITGLLNEGWPGLVDQTGLGPVTAAQLVISYSHHGRCKTEAAFARLAACAPIPASSGRTVRHRLDPGGDRKLNAALHVIAIHRARHDPETKAYIEKKLREGKTAREARRSLKRHIARRLYHDLKNMPIAT
jgi:transposase